MSVQEVLDKISSGVQKAMPEYAEKIKWSRKHIEDHQLEKLKELIRHAEKNSSYYKKQFSGINIDTPSPC